jgi:hypothetical protein
MRATLDHEPAVEILILSLSKDEDFSTAGLSSSTTSLSGLNLPARSAG